MAVPRLFSVLVQLFTLDAALLIVHEPII
jgi:hypothetical protein